MTLGVTITLVADGLDLRLTRGAEEVAVARHAVTLTPGETAPEAWTAGLAVAWPEITAAADGASIDRVAVGSTLGAVLLADAAGRPLGPALWGDDARTAPDAGWLRSQVPATAWEGVHGAPPTAATGLAKLSFLHRTDPPRWAAGAWVMGETEFLVHHLTGRRVTTTGLLGSSGYCDAGGLRIDLLSVVDRDRDWTGSLAPVVPAGSEVGQWHGAVVLVDPPR